MTTEQKAKAYDEAIERAKYLKENTDGVGAKDVSACFDYIFPELKESDGERIRQILITKVEKWYESALENNAIQDIKDSADAITWLEKQNHDGKKWISEDDYNRDKEQTYRDGMDEVLNNPEKYGLEKQGEYKPTRDYSTLEITDVVRQALQECEDYRNIRADLYAARVGATVEFLIQKQGEHSIYNVPSREAILSIWDLGNEWKELTGGSISTEHGTQLNYIQKHWSESEYYLRVKQGEQKPADKVEPMFKVGDWVVNKFGNVWHIDSLDKKNYRVSDGNKYNYFPIAKQNEMHLWTIADAKDGDVLAVEDVVFVYKRILSSHVVSYCILYNGIFDPREYARTCHEDNSNIHPATKEQRDTLLKAMADAGYIFDFEKKELKKIEQKPAWSEDDETRFKNLCWLIDLSNENNATKKGFKNWLKSIKDRVKLQSKSELDEEDLIILERVKYDVNKRKEHYEDRNATDCAEQCEEELLWLDSLKERI